MGQVHPGWGPSSPTLRVLTGSDLRNANGAKAKKEHGRKSRRANEDHHESLVVDWKYAKAAQEGEAMPLQVLNVPVGHQEA